ncbi:MAG: arsenate reductase ArsC [Candidatus Methanomethyliaceae archaeon]|nr:arsenate reductase ArsC [Candidatus Methanomethyliaceae archaeon]MDW7970983.1 arsenate reductase ArsC [Nitrososphaerota archaeon]
MKTILFVCVENSFRSQIAEAYFNKFAPKGWRAISAGLMPAENVHPNAIKLMQEEGIDISDKRPKLMKKEYQKEADVVIIVCSGSLCPAVNAKYVENWNLPDPAKMSLEEARKIRDIIKERVLKLIEKLIHLNERID